MGVMDVQLRATRHRPERFLGERGRLEPERPRHLGELALATEGMPGVALRERAEPLRVRVRDLRRDQCTVIIIEAALRGGLPTADLERPQTEDMDHPVRTSGWAERGEGSGSGLQSRIQSSTVTPGMRS
jgi:hypothetical protein